MNEFYKFHPIVNFIYFAFVILFAMFLMNPICIIISFISSFCYTAILCGKNGVKFNLYMIPIVIIAILINVLFNHKGATILGYFDNGNPLTMESVVYGIASGMMLITVISWFNLFNKVITTDKILYIFGKRFPSLSLLFSMIFRFVPRFTNQIKEISNAQKCIGKDIENGNLIQKIKNGLSILSAEITLAFDNSIETAESMKARGYKSGDRTFFTIYKMNSRDKKVLITIIIVGIYVLLGICFGATSHCYYPEFRMQEVNLYTSSIFFMYAFLCIIPIIIEIGEEIKWRKLKSKI